METDNRKIPPQSIESEMSILGAIFLENECLKKVTGLVDINDFYREGHRKIFRAMIDLSNSGSPIDFITSIEALKKKGELEEIGGGAYLATLVDYVPSSANVAYYCKIVKNMAVRRQMIVFSQHLSQMAYDEEDVGEIIPEAKAGLAEIVENMDSFGGVSSKDLTTALDRGRNYEKRIKTIDQDRLTTDFDELDRLIRGVCPGEVLAIVAEPGGFKTAFLQNILQAKARKEGCKTLLFSMEMPDDKIFEREVQIECEVSGWDVESYFKGQQQYGIHQPALDMVRKSGMIVCSKPRLSIERMDWYIELAKQKYGALTAVGIDFIQLMQGPGKIFDRIEFNAYGIKTLAKSQGVPIIELSQINVVGRKDKSGICFSDAKGGGAIEEAADIGLGFYHDKNGGFVCEILKNRNGPKGKKFSVDLNRKAFKFLSFSNYVETAAKKEETDNPY